MLCVFHVFQTVGYYGFGTLVPTVLAAKGYSIVTSLTFTSLTFIGYPSARRCRCRSSSGSIAGG